MRLEDFVCRCNGVATQEMKDDQAIGSIVFAKPPVMAETNSVRDTDKTQEILHGMTKLLGEWEDEFTGGFKTVGVDGINAFRMALFGGFIKLAREAREM
jgi:hypothetical protein